MAAFARTFSAHLPTPLLQAAHTTITGVDVQRAPPDEDDALDAARRAPKPVERPVDLRAHRRLERDLHVIVVWAVCNSGVGCLERHLRGGGEVAPVALRQETVLKQRRARRRELLRQQRQLLSRPIFGTISRRMPDGERRGAGSDRKPASERSR